MKDMADLIREHFYRLTDYYGAIAQGHERWPGETRCSLGEAREYLDMAIAKARKEIEDGRSKS